MINMQPREKESLIGLARRAMKNADSNNRIITIKDDCYDCLVYPNDKPNKVVKTLKIQQLVNKLKKLNDKYR